MGISATLDTPFYTGQPVSSDVPGRFPVSIAGHPYMVDLSFEPYRRDAFRHRSIESARPASDINNIPGENSINTQGLWRRTMEDWSHGAGQLWYDRHNNDPSQFHQSKGVDPFTEQWQLSLLHDTAKTYTSTHTNLFTAVAGSALYVTDGNTVQKTTDGTSWTPLTGVPTAAAVGIASDGLNVYIAYGANSTGLYVSASSGTSATQLVTSGAIDHVGYVKGRLMVTVGAAVYNIVSAAPAVLPAVLYTHPNAGWGWVGFSEGPDFIYAAGFAGNTSIVYRFGIATDGTALVAPIASATLPPGEIVYAISSWANTFIMLGTNNGVRFCTLGNGLSAPQGDILIGSFIPVNPMVTLPVRTFATWEHFIWFGWSNFDATSTGLGRMDLQVLTDPATPAFCSDLMATAQGAVLSASIFGGTPVFTVSGVGLFSQAATYVASGYLDSGQVEYDIPDDKIAQFVTCRYLEPMPGSSSPAVSVDMGAFVSVGTRTAGQPNQPFNVPQLRGGYFEVRHTLASGNANTTAPTLTRQILKALPGVSSGTIISVTVILADQVLDLNDAPLSVDIAAEFQFLDNLRQQQTLVTYQEGNVSYQVTIDSIDYLPYSFSKKQSAYVAVAVLYLKTISG